MWLQCNDIKVYYEEYGAAGRQAMILLHGNSSNHNYFKYQIAYFQRYFHVYVLDTRGHGKSGHGTKRLNFDVLAEDLHIFIQKKNLNNLILLGFSDGGNIALTYTLKYPDSVSSLILNGANLKPEGMRWTAHKVTLAVHRILGYAAPYVKAIQKRQQIWELMAKHPHISTKELKAVKMPVLVIAGEFDLIRERHTRMMANVFPRGKLVIIKKAGHLCAMKRPREFNRIVLQFLVKQKKAED